ncbi:DUF397 domain-containing protein [Streptomyces sp. NPDC046831]|uniref:DUF397 domain-containing protein n=1 Tax=Streptomyces sp. NPDC046831 TaxID=3154805 RepID=UPI0033F22784
MSDTLAWFKSSYSDSQGGACLEVAYAWGESCRNDSSGCACGAAAATPRAIQVRDSKLGARGPRFAVPAGAWAAFLAYAAHGA